MQAVREGYFARDKKNNAVDVEGWDSSVDDSDVKLKVKSQEDIDRGISLILEKKDELVSFEEPLAFIFSHSALREGWDNPNVFTLCTLKAGGSDIAKKQEIGKGGFIDMADIKYEIIEQIGVLSESAKGWTKELNKISWNGGEPKYDIRDWAPGHDKMGKGVTLTHDEAEKLFVLLKDNL